MDAAVKKLTATQYPQQQFIDKSQVTTSDLSLGGKEVKQVSEKGMGSYYSNFFQETGALVGEDFAHGFENAFGQKIGDDTNSALISEEYANSLIDVANEKALRKFISSQGGGSLSGVLNTRMNTLQVKAHAHQLDNNKPALTKKENQFLQSWTEQDALSPELHQILESKVCNSLGKGKLALTPVILEEFAVQASEIYCAEKIERTAFSRMLDNIGTQEFASDWVPGESSKDVETFNKFYNLELDGFTIFGLRGVQVPTLSEEEQLYLFDLAFSTRNSNDKVCVESSELLHPLISYVQDPEFKMEPMSQEQKTKNYDCLWNYTKSWYEHNRVYGGKINLLETQYT
jgi:hypothetical protein